PLRGASSCSLPAVPSSLSPFPPSFPRLRLRSLRFSVPPLCEPRALSGGAIEPRRRRGGGGVRPCGQAVLNSCGGLSARPHASSLPALRAGGLDGPRGQSVSAGRRTIRVSPVFLLWPDPPRSLRLPPASWAAQHLPGEISAADAGRSASRQHVQ